MSASGHNSHAKKYMNMGYVMKHLKMVSPVIYTIEVFVQQVVNDTELQIPWLA